MTTSARLDDVLGDFAMEPSLTPALLKQYIERYPEHAEAILDLYHELTFTELQARTDLAKADSIPSETASANASTPVATALAGERVRALAEEHALPRDFFLGFRDVRIRFGSIPGNAMTAFARAIGVRVVDLVGHLCAHDGSGPQLAFKADRKPDAASVLDYDAFIDELNLTDTEAAALAALIDADGPD